MSGARPAAGVAPEGPQRGDLAQKDFSGNSDKTA
jgi:hypothetical protein